MNSVQNVVVTGSFDDLRSRHVRFLEEAAKLGRVGVLLWSDEVVRNLQGKAPAFPENERQYLVQAIRYVDHVTLCTGPLEHDALPPQAAARPGIWVVDEASDNAAKQAYCRAYGLEYRVLRQEDLKGFPHRPPDALERDSSRTKVIVTGCYDWFHSGHVTFFEEVSRLGDLYVVVGHDDNIRLLKGEGHPMFPAQQRSYMVQAVRYVSQALIATGYGWLDAASEILRIKPQIYAVNEDGDRPEKRQFCQTRGIQYRVLKRVPKEGLPERQSRALRGF